MAPTATTTYDREEKVKEHHVTDQNYVHDLLVIDRSSSMKDIQAGMQSGFQEFLAAQKRNPVRTTASLVQFDDVIERLYSIQPLEALTEYQLVPRGMTNLYDAIIEAVTTEGEKLSAIPEEERPALVNVIIISDGMHTVMDNKHTGPEAASVLEHQRTVYKWNVLYMGTNQDALAEGEKVGVHRDQSLSYQNTDKGAKMAWSASSSSLSRASAASAAGMEALATYTDAERKLAEGGK